MAVTTDKFDQFKLERLKTYLEDMAGKGQARHYEIFVGNLKVVAKTDDPKEFDSYERYMDETTEKIRIVIYNSGASPRNDQYYFTVHPNRQGNSLNGLDELDGIIQEKLAARDREYELNQLKKDLEETKKQVLEAEEYADALLNQLNEAKTNKFKVGNINVGELASVALEGIIRRNPQLLHKLPGGEALAGVFEQDNIDKSLPGSETTASFQKKSQHDTGLKPEHLQYIPVLQQLDAAFDEQQLEIVTQILTKLSAEPENLKTVADLLNIQI